MPSLLNEVINTIMKHIQSIRRRTWAEINIDNAKCNYNIIRNTIGKDVKLCCVIKANAYGHGAIELARLYESWGADYFAVSNIEEALQLRKGGISLPILVMGYTPPECAKELSIYAISQCVYSPEYAQALNTCARNANCRVDIHIKIDTGMGRIGFVCRPECYDGIKAVMDICSLSNLVANGIFTHFAVADESCEKDINSYTNQQYKSFAYAIDYLENNGFKFKIRHCANSAGIFLNSAYHMDMVRGGIVLYGLLPSQSSNIDGLKPVMSLKTIVSQVKEISAGESIGYGRAFIAKRNVKVATLAIGYADGLDRSSVGYYVMIGNSRASIIGKICMDQCMIDATDIDCRVGDVVTVFSDNTDVSADAMAAHIGTINYEVVCDIGERVPRIYIQNDEVVGIRDAIYNV